MKKLIGIAALTVITFGAFAQDSTMRDTNSQDSSTWKKNMKKDCFGMKDGKMVKVPHGDTAMVTMMDSSVMLTNGATVMTDGTVKSSDGTTKMLKEGQYVDTDGKWGKMKKMMKKEGM